MFEYVPALLVPVVGLSALAAGIWYGRHSAADKLAAARRLSAAASTYWARADQVRRQVHAIESPTQAMDLTGLRAATATRRERLTDWAREVAEQAVEAVRPTGAPRDWAEGEMTAAFTKIVDEQDWGWADRITLPANPSPWAPPRHELPAPPPAPAPALVMAPRGPQTPPRWQDRPAPPRRDRTARVAPRERAWNSPLLGLTVPPLALPDFPQPFRMPTPRRRPTPALMARLADDPTRAYRTKVVAA